MPIVTDTTTIRKQYQAVSDLYICIPPLTVFATANVNGTPGTFPTAEITVDGASADWTNTRPQQLFRIKRSGALIFEAALRKGLDSATKLYIPAINDGDTGVATEFAQSIQDNDTVEVYDPIVPYAYFSRLNVTTTYKRYDVEWDDGVPASSQLTKYPQPVVNFGKHLHIRVAPGDTAQWTMDSSDSFTFNGNGIIRLWLPPTGVSFVSPSVDSDVAVTFEAGVGVYKIRLRLEDATTGRRDSGYRYVFITDDTNETAFSDDFAITAIQSDETSRLGRALNVTVNVSRGTDVMSRLYKGAPFLLTYRHVYSSDGWINTSTTEDVIENFYGYVRSFEKIGTTPDGVDTYEIRVESPLMYFGSLPVAIQTILADTDPDSWQKVLDTFISVLYFIYYILQHHAGALLSLSDFLHSDLDDLIRGVLSSPAGDMLTAATKVINLRTGANIGCLSDGSIVSRRHPCYENDTFRDALAEVWTYQATDVEGDIDYKRDPVMTTSEMEGSFTITSTDVPPAFNTARAGVLAGMQGVAKSNIDSFIALDENDGRDVVGHAQQEANMATKAFSLDIPGGHDFTDPALMEWETMGLADYDPGDTGVLSNRTVPLAVSRTWEFTERGIIKRLKKTWQPEFKGKRAPLKPSITLGNPLVTTWCYYQDFSLNNGGWTQSQGTFQSGVGYYGATDNVTLQQTFSTFTLTSVEAVFNSNWGGINPRIALLVANSSTVINSTTSSGATTITLSVSPAYTNTIIRLDFDRQIGGNQAWGTIRLIGLRFRGTGTNPFGTSNC